MGNVGDEIKIRIAGDPVEVEQLTALLRSWAKPWGKRKIFRVRRFNRDPAHMAGFHSTLGKAPRVNYIKLKLPKAQATKRYCQKKCPWDMTKCERYTAPGGYLNGIHCIYREANKTRERPPR